MAPVAMQPPGVRSRLTLLQSENAAGNRDDSVNEREQLAALLECSPAHSQSVQGGGHVHHVQPVGDVPGAVNDGGEGSLQGEASLRHHARSGSGADARRAGTACGQAASISSLPQQGTVRCGAEAGSQQHSDMYKNGSPGHGMKVPGGPHHHLMVMPSDAAMPSPVQQAGQRPLSRQSLHPEDWGRGNAGQSSGPGWAAAPSQLEATMPASIRFSTTSDEGAGTPFKECTGT